MRFYCTSCGVRIEVPSAMEGVGVDCPECGWKLTVPMLMTSGAGATHQELPNVSPVDESLIQPIPALPTARSAHESSVDRESRGETHQEAVSISEIGKPDDEIRPVRSSRNSAGKRWPRNSVNWYSEAMKKGVVFSGRARRKEFWMFFLFNNIIGFSIMVVGNIAESLVAGDSSPPTGIVATILGWIFFLIVMVPCIAVSVRRLHDTSRSGWWLSVGLLPFVGQIVLLAFYMEKGVKGDNKYGPDPKVA